MKRYAWDTYVSEDEENFTAGATASGTQTVEESVSSSDGEDFRTPSAEEAGELLAQYLLNNHKSGRLTAKDVCVISHWATLAGACGVQGMAKGPETQSGNFKRHLEKYLNPSDTFQTYSLEVPSQCKASEERQPVTLQVLPPHEVFAEACAQEKWPELLETATKKNKLPPNYGQHPIVRSEEQGVPIVPCVLFLDGVNYVKHDSMIVFVLQSLLTNTQMLCLALRKRWMCRCGCRGWCTLNAVFVFLRWSLDQMSKGRWPSTGHDGRALTGPRASKAGQSFLAKGILLQIRADWAEMVTRLGLPSWHQNQHPCFICNASRATLYSKMAQPEWKLKTWTDYCSACSNAEVYDGPIDDADWAALKEILEPDMRKQGSQGLALSKPYAKLALKKGDRLEVTAAMIDWQDFWEKKPDKVLFWRPVAGAPMKHRCALFDKAIGTDLQSCMAIDSMHTLCLGVFAQWVAHTCWAILGANLSGSSASDQLSRDTANMVALKRNLFLWYPAAEKALKGCHTVTRVSDITLNMIGSRGSPHLHLKAGETVGVLRFLARYLTEVSDKMQDGASWATGSALLVGLWNKIQEAPVVVPAALIQERACHGRDNGKPKPPFPPIPLSHPKTTAVCNSIPKQNCGFSHDMVFFPKEKPKSKNPRASHNRRSSETTFSSSIWRSSLGCPKCQSITSLCT